SKECGLRSISWRLYCRGPLPRERLVCPAPLPATTGSKSAACERSTESSAMVEEIRNLRNEIDANLPDFGSRVLPYRADRTRPVRQCRGPRDPGSQLPAAA